MINGLIQFYFCLGKTYKDIKFMVADKQACLLELVCLIRSAYFRANLYFRMSMAINPLIQTTVHQIN